MSARAKARRERVAHRTDGPAPAESSASGPPSAPARGRLRTLPLLWLALVAGLALVAATWATRQTPGEPRASDRGATFTIDIPANRQRVINSWERFFICYDLASDPRIVDLTLRANQRATGTFDFPIERVIVALPVPGDPQEPLASGGEDELLAAKSAVLGAAVPERLAAVRQQCAQ